MHLGPLQIGAIVVGAVVARLLWDRWKGRGQRTAVREPPLDRLSAAPTVPLGELTPDQDACVYGLAKPAPGQPLQRSPLSGQTCLAWKLSVTRSIGSPNDAFGPTGEWEHLFSESGGDALELRDGAHAVLVRLRDANWFYPHEMQVTRYESELTGPQRASLERNGVAWEGYWKPMLTFHEYVVLADEPLGVFGVAQVEGAPAGPYRSPPPRLVFAADGDRPLVLFVGDDGKAQDGGEPDDDDGGDAA